MKPNEKLTYVSPSFKVQNVFIEESLAASSATVSGGDNDDPFLPDIEDWEDGGSEVLGGDL